VHEKPFHVLEGRTEIRCIVDGAHFSTHKEQLLQDANGISIVCLHIEGAIFSALLIFSNDNTCPNTNPKQPHDT